MADQDLGTIGAAPRWFDDIPVRCLLCEYKRPRIEREGRWGHETPNGFFPCVTGTLGDFRAPQEGHHA